MTVRQMARLGLVAVLLGLAGACGGADDGGDGVATLGGDQDAGEVDASGSGGEVTDAEREDAMLEFAECMREHGVDMPDPTEDGGIRISATPETQDEMEAAQEACQPILEETMGERPQLSPEEEAQMRDEMLAFTECMREHGVDMPDPEFGDGGEVRVRVGGGDGSGGPPPDDDEFQAAQEACRDELGFEGGPGGRVLGPGAGSTSSRGGD